MSNNIILKNDLFDKLLVRPSQNFDTLCILSGFATPGMVVHHFDEVNKKLNNHIKIKLLIGMTPLGIKKSHHLNFINLINKYNVNFECSYIKPNSSPIHSKIYIWLKDNEPKLSFISSANYTLTGFKKYQDEIACECSPIDAFNYFNAKVNDSFYCNYQDASLLVKESITWDSLEDKEEIMTQNDNFDSVYLPLFSEKENRMHTAAGLNWGQREGREPNQAYIPIPSTIANSGFFPERGQQFSVETDDGYGFVCVVAQDNGKAIHSTNNNSELGEYFRNKLGVNSGDPVSLEDLDRYGNRYVKFTKISDEDYFMEFLPNNE